MTLVSAFWIGLHGISGEYTYQESALMPSFFDTARFPAILIMAGDPSDLTSRVDEIVGKSSAFPNNLSLLPDKPAGGAPIMRIAG